MHRLKRLAKLVAAGIFPVFDIILAPVTFLCCAWLGIIRKVMHKLGPSRVRLSRKIFRSVGVFPIVDHYYEPLFNPKHLRYSLQKERALPGVDFNLKEQLDILKRFNFNEELMSIPVDEKNPLEFYYHNGSLGSGDSEYLYNVIRLFKPLRIIEAGSGYSTLMSIKAAAKNREENGKYACRITCFEPYEKPWLEKVGVDVVRARIEEAPKDIFAQLGPNDIFFVDSSHIIRPQGDVLFEFLEILPALKSGVLVHIHDIFTPRDYPEGKLVDEVLFTNEQYLLEAFLSLNKDFKIIGSLNYLTHNYFAQLSSCCPMLQREPDREPGSFWIARR